MWMRKSTFRAYCLAVIAVFASVPAQAQDYPARPVTLILPAAAGNSPDVVTRVVADRLSQMWKQQMVVINRPGAGGLIAVQAAAGLPKDGYSLYMTQASTYTVLPIEQEGKMPVDLDDRVRADRHGRRAADRHGRQQGCAGEQRCGADQARQHKPGGMLFGATNRGGQSHLTGELFRERAKANITFVHAAGASVSLNDVIAGRIPIMFEGLAGLAPGLQGGAIRLLGVAAPQRLPNRAGSARDQRNRARGCVERLDPADGARRHADADHRQGQHGPAQGRGRP